MTLRLACRVCLEWAGDKLRSAFFSARTLRLCSVASAATCVTIWSPVASLTRACLAWSARQLCEMCAVLYSSLSTAHKGMARVRNKYKRCGSNALSMFCVQPGPALLITRQRRQWLCTRDLCCACCPQQLILTCLTAMPHCDAVAQQLRPVQRLPRQAGSCREGALRRGVYDHPTRFAAGLVFQKVACI